MERNKAKKKQPLFYIATDWNSRERVDMYRNNELIYHCSKCLGMSARVGQGGWIGLNVAKYEAIKQKEYHELNTIADNIKYYANNN